MIPKKKEISVPTYSISEFPYTSFYNFQAEWCFVVFPNILFKKRGIMAAIKKIIYT